MEILKFLPSYVGSKAYWIDALKYLKNEYIVELFSGSAVISANLASKALLNDIDVMLIKIFQNYNNLIVPPIFTKEDYLKMRWTSDWYKYAYCFQQMSFSGVFRYSKNGYNVPVKNIAKIEIQDKFEKSKKRFNELNPIITNLPYNQVQIPHLESAVVVLDPPYENSKASYNSKFNYHEYWEFVRKLEGKPKKIILFDKQDNMPFPNYLERKMRVNGKYPGGVECMFVFENSLKNGQIGEEAFFQKYSNQLIRLDGKHGDFQLIQTRTKIELKSDYYDMQKTPNFFMERYSDENKKNNGGPWQALEHNCEFFIYYFLKNDKAYIFNTRKLVDKLNQIITEMEEKKIPNKSWTTTGYLIQRDWLHNLEIFGLLD